MNAEFTIRDPTDQDVLCGRGRKVRLHKGNQYYIQLIQGRSDEYEKAQKGSKSEVVKMVVQAIQNEQGLFLQKKGDHWVELPHDKAVIKTSQAFRDLRNEDASVDVARSSTNKSHTTAFKCDLLKRHAPAGRFTAILQRFGEEKRNTSEETADESSSSEEADESSGADAESKSKEDDLSSSSDDENDDDDDDDDVSETETEDSFPIYRGSKT